MGDSVAVPLVATPAEERYPALSPDGRWLAYRSSETNRAAVYVQPFPNVSEGKWAVSPPGGSEPLWSHSGKELFYINDDGEMVAVTLQTQPTFAVVSQQVLFKLPPGTLRAVSHQAFDITPDDRRFVMISQVGAGGRGRPTPTAGGHLEVVQNWFEELQAKAPVRH